MSYNRHMTQSLSVSCKLEVPEKLRPDMMRTFDGFADACNSVLAVAKSEDCWNTTKLHHLTYYIVRDATGLKANHVCQAIRRVIDNSKATRKIKKFRPTSVSLDARTFVFHENEWKVGVTLISGRANFNLLIGNYQRALLKGQKPTSAVLVRKQDSSYHINIAIEIDTPPTGKTPKVIGVDLGRRDIATTSTAQAWNGEPLQAIRDRFSRTRAKVQSKRSRSSRRLLRRLSGRERRFQEWVNHNISRSLVDAAKREKAALAFEDLTGIRQSLNGKPRSKTGGGASPAPLSDVEQTIGRFFNCVCLSITRLRLLVFLSCLFHLLTRARLAAAVTTLVKERLSLSSVLTADWRWMPISTPPKILRLLGLL